MIKSLIGLVAAALAAAALAQGRGPGGATLTKAQDVEDLVRRMTAFDKDGDGKLTKAEVSDPRLHGLFDRADADRDGSVGKAELTALAEAEHSGKRDLGGGPPPGGPGGPPPRGPGFDGFPGTPAARPGEVLSPPVRQALGLTPDQRKKVDDLQARVDAALAEILTDSQEVELKQVGRRPGPPPPPR